jgi:DNA-binding response OmpR family regulator
VKRILLVDDEKDFVESVKDFLEMRGYEVMVAYDGMSALESAQKLPDLVLLDIKMPVMDGYEVLRRLQASRATAEIPVIMLTTKSETSSIFDAQKLSATDYIIKPTNLQELLDMIKKYLDENRRRPVKI